MKKIGKLIEGYKGAGTAFIYSNLVKAGGMEIFARCINRKWIFRISRKSK